MSDMIGVIIAASVMAFALFGWGNNIYKLYFYSEQMETEKIIIRAAGVPFVPIGIIMGYVDV